MIKIGEIVRLKDNLEPGITYGGMAFYDFMNEFKGKKLEVIRSYPNFVCVVDRERKLEMITVSNAMVVLG